MAPNVQLVKDSDAAREVPGAFSKEQRDVIRRMFCKNATDDEFEVYCQACKRTNLDPLLKQIHFLKFKDTASIIVGIDGLRLIAERTGKYMPGREPTYIYTKSGDLFSATAYVKRRASDGTWHESAATAHFSEYKAGNLWATKPHVMLSKCAEALALRRAFPADMSGLYSEDEMEQVKMMVRDSIDVSSCEKVEPLHQKVTLQPEEGKAVNGTSRASLRDTKQLEADIDQYITPYDPDYKVRMLMAFNVKYIEQLTDEDITKARKNMAKKILELKALPDKASECPL